MLKSLNVVRSGVIDTSPFLPPRFCDVFSLGAAGISAIGGLFGANQSAKAQREANEMNYKINQENNAFNERMQLQNQSWQEDMWNKANAYNDPSAQVERLVSAGINPAMVLGNGSISDAGSLSGSATSASSSNPMQAYDYASAYNRATEGAINAYNQSRLANSQSSNMDADTQIKQIQAEFDGLSMMSRLREQMYRADKGSVEYKQAQSDYEFARAAFQSNLDILRGNVAQTSANTRLLENRIMESEIQQDLSRVALQYAPKLNDAQIASLNAGVSSALAAARANDSQALLNAAKTAVEKASEVGLHLDNGQKAKITDYIVDSAKSAALSGQKDSRLVRLSDLPGLFFKQMFGNHGTFDLK